MKLLTLLMFTNALVIAQTFNGVVVSGTVENPTIINQRSQPVMGFALWKYSIGATLSRDELVKSSGISRIQNLDSDIKTLSESRKSLTVVLDIDSIANNVLINSGEEQSALGLSGSFHPKSEGRATGYALAAVLLSDGTFIGPDDILKIFATKLYELRSAARDIQYRAEKFRLMEEDRRALRRAERINTQTNLSDTLLTIRNNKGEAEAEAALIRLANLPDVVKGENQ